MDKEKRLIEKQRNPRSMWFLLIDDTENVVVSIEAFDDDALRAKVKYRVETMHAVHVEMHRKDKALKQALYGEQRMKQFR